ncbi:unnamed protein product [Brachionus calyciflorus]|uniref:Uncharacterized protein n=1 Tax=Brachionus calyciflorus TaxID=104777 RepID=A0A814N635_9BILA|nr:unnamed protein product [Brachionus calyciflorus]
MPRCELFRNLSSIILTCIHEQSLQTFDCRNFINYDKIKKLVFEATPIINIYNISYLNKLQVLHIGSNTKLSMENFELKNLKELKYFFLSDKVEKQFSLHDTFSENEHLVHFFIYPHDLNAPINFKSNNLEHINFGELDINYDYLQCLEDLNIKYLSFSTPRIFKFERGFRKLQCLKIINLENYMSGCFEKLNELSFLCLSFKTIPVITKTDRSMFDELKDYNLIHLFFKAIYDEEVRENLQNLTGFGLFGNQDGYYATNGDKTKFDFDQRTVIHNILYN